MDGKVINLGAVTEEVPSSPAQASDRAEPALDGSRFNDEGRFQSSEVTRAFASVIRAGSLGPPCDVSAPNDVTLEPSVDPQIVRGDD